MERTSKIPFLDGYKISISDIPKYDHFTCGFVEKLDVALLKIIYDSDKLKEKPEIKSQLKNVLDAIDKKGYLKVKHYQAKKCGRFYADKNISIIPLSKYVKHSIFHYLGWIDLDWIKGHPSIAMEVAKSVGGLLPMFTRYSNDFDSIVKTISDYYSLDPNDPLTKDNIKWLFNSMIYGGGFDSWVRGVTEGDETYTPKKLKNTNHIHSLIVDFKGECKYVIDRIYRENPSLVKKVCNQNDELYQKKNTTASYWFQIIENHVIHVIADFLLERGIIKSGEFGCEYDGLNIPPCDIPDKDSLVNEINDLVKLKTGMDFKFKFKEYDENYILHDCIEKRRMLVDNEEEDKVTNNAQILMDIINSLGEPIGGMIDNMVSKNSESESKSIRGCTDFDIGLLLHHYYKDRFACVHLGENTWYEFKNHRWYYTEGGKVGLRFLISTEFREKFKNAHEFCSDKLEVLEDDKCFESKILKKIMEYLSHIIEILGSTKNKQNIMIECKDLFYKSDFEENLDMQTHLLCFTNGVFDFHTLQFRDGLPEDMNSMCTKIPWVPLNEEEISYMNEIERRMFIDPLGSDVGKYFILCIARALAGHQQKTYLFCVGGTDRGKTYIIEYCSLAFGDYVDSFNVECLAHKMSFQDEGQKMRWLYLLRKKRIIYSSEGQETLNGEILKKASGHDPLKGRVHCKNETTFKFHGLPISFANGLAKIKPFDDAVKNRVKVVEFTKQFVDNPTDPRFHLQKIDSETLKVEINSELFKRVFMGLIIRAYTEYVYNGRVHEIPDKVKNAAAEWSGDDGMNIIERFLEDYKITNNESDFVVSKDLQIWYEQKNTGISFVSFTKDLRKHCMINNLNSVQSKDKKINGKTQKCWFGIKLIQYVPELETEIDTEYVEEIKFIEY